MRRGRCAKEALHWVQTAYAEAVKQHWAFYHERYTYVVMLLWPVLGFASVYYAFRPFMGGGGSGFTGAGFTEDSIIAFALTGYMGYTFFWSLVQSAWRFTFERFWGTLEMVSLTPADLKAVIVGNATGALFESVWTFTIFFFGFGLLFGRMHLHSGTLMLLLGCLTISALAWGSLLNSVFLLSRDASFLFTVFEDPLTVLTGVRFPVDFLPLWLRYVSNLFPLTWSLRLLRAALVHDGPPADLWRLVGINLVIAAIQMPVMYLLTLVGERRARRTGQYALF